MKETFIYPKSSIFYFLIGVAEIFLFGLNANAQCGISASPGPGGPYIPTSAFQQTTPTGSGTYQTFSVTAGDIYSFYISDSGSTAPDPTTSIGNDWDLTLSSSSAIIPYNNIY